MTSIFDCVCRVCFLFSGWGGIAVDHCDPRQYFFILQLKILIMRKFVMVHHLQILKSSASMIGLFVFIVICGCPARIYSKFLPLRFPGQRMVSPLKSVCLNRNLRKFSAMQRSATFMYCFLCKILEIRELQKHTVQ